MSALDSAPNGTGSVDINAQKVDPTPISVKDGDSSNQMKTPEEEISLEGCILPLCGCNNLSSDELLSLIQGTNDRWLQVGLSNITDKERIFVLDLLDTIAIDLSTRNEDPYTLLPRVLAVIANLSPSSASKSVVTHQSKHLEHETLSITSRHQKSTLISKNDDDDWDQSLKYFQSNDISKGVQLLINARKSDPLNATKRNSFKAVTSLDAVIQILVKQRVKQLLKFPKLPDPSPFDLIKFIKENQTGPVEKTIPNEESGVWITAKCPARIDIAGGWSDTPPICYEMGGKVVNIAIKVNGEKPIGARVRKISIEDYSAENKKSLILVKEMSNRTPDETIVNEIQLNTIQDVMTFDQFFNPGSLVKAALICTNIVCDSRTAPSLEDQLKSKIGAGMEIETWSHLPAGSGLGTSSILASCIIAVLWKLTGRTFTKSDLVHATLYLEQVITTGGGYQDQVAGVYGGINLSVTTRCPSSHETGGQLVDHNLQVQVYPVKISQNDLETLMSRLVLLYTGTVRLAKNILQNVIRNWYSKNKLVIECFQELLESSDKCCKLLVSGNIDRIGKCRLR